MKRIYRRVLCIVTLVICAYFLLYQSNIPSAINHLFYNVEMKISLDTNIFTKKTLLTTMVSQILGNDKPTTTSVIQFVTAKQLQTTLTAATRPPDCPQTPEGLVGDRGANMSELSVQELERMFSFLKPGGDYSPPHCQPAQRTAIIIPYRNRSAHLRILLHNLVPFLVRQELSFTFFVMEMPISPLCYKEEPTTFNRALLLNAGILEALKADNYTCFIFHDVDLIPLNDHNLYRCGKQPQHFAVALNKWDYKIKYPQYFGGVTALSRDQIEKVNGFSNLYFGWGGEDDDLLRRVLFKGMQAERKTLNVTRYDMILHKIDKGNEVSPIALQIREKATSRLSIDGLNSIRYTRDSIELKPLYTWIKIFVNMTDVIMNAPAYERSLMMNNTGTVKNETV